MKLLNNNRGAVIELIALFVVLLLLAFVFMMGNVINTNIQNDATIVEMKADNVHVQTAFTNIQYNYDATDNIFAVFFFSLMIGSIVLSFMVRSHPIFAVMGLIVLIIILLFVPTISNAFVELDADESFDGVNLPKTTFIMENLPWLLMINGFIIMMALYGVSNRL